MSAEPEPEEELPPGWPPKEEYDWIYSRVPRLCVEIVVISPERGVLLTLRDIPPNVGVWHIAGGAVLFRESVEDAVRHVARCELGTDVRVGELLGYIECLSHHENGLDSPVGLAFRCTLEEESALPEIAGWFTELPKNLYAEQRAFLVDVVRFGSLVADKPDQSLVATP